MMQVPFLRFLGSIRGRAALAAIALAAAAFGPSLAGGPSPMRFAAEMAASGNWREALFRWERAVADRPEDARLLNNLAVAREAMGENDVAAELYERALALAPDDRTISDNAARSKLFWTTVGGGRADPVAIRALAAGDGKKKGRKATKVAVPLPVPPRLDLGERRRILVASFLTADDEILDSNRELPRFLRGEFRKTGALEVLDVTPPPAIPEQTLDDLAENAAFWRHLGDRHDAEIIVSGAVSYDKADVSGYREVDIVSPRTGQKVRTNRFTEQERFRYSVTLLFFDGRSGELLYRDAVRKSIVYTGLNNDPVTAFFDISESLSRDVLAVVTAQRRTEYRFIFRG